MPEKPISRNCVTPFHDTNVTPVDMNHNWNSAHADYDGGKMDGFVYSGGSSETIIPMAECSEHIPVVEFSRSIQTP
ncbi:MAG: hypothetical protein PXY39_00090 [archaeon]|nr:hypothetical protein [archaeon]